MKAILRANNAEQATIVPMTFYTIQLLRFIAALLVLLFHLGTMPSGYKGVDIFFVISGFIMYFILFCSRRPQPFIFFVNRLTKIFFLYWLALIIRYMVRPFMLDASIIHTILLLPGHYSVLGISWSLSFELYFYFIIAAVAYGLPRRFSKIVLLSILVAAAMVTVSSTQLNIKGTPLNYLLGRNTFEFFLGIGSAFLANIIVKSVNAGIALVIAVVSLSLLLFINVPYGTTSVLILVYGTLSMLLVGCMTAFEKAVQINERMAAAFKILGDASYAIYLLVPIVPVLIAGRDVFSKMIIVIATVFFSIILNRYIENIGLRYCRNRLYKLRPLLRSILPVGD